MAAKIRLAICAQADLGIVPAGKQVIFIDALDNTIKVKKDDQLIYLVAGGVGSVNGQTGAVVIDADDIDDSTTTNKFVTAADLTKLGYITVTQAVDLDSIESLANAAIPSSQKGASGGIATLDGSGKVPLSQLNSAVMTYEGLWNASTNTPSLANGTGDAGMIYITSVAGSTNFGAGSIAFAIGDWAIYNGTIWEKAINSNSVVSVNGKSGVVVLDKTDIGLSNVDNVSDASKPVSTAQATAIGLVQTAINDHEADLANPHSVTKTQVGLSNVDNTSDTNKPISTDVATALSGKAATAHTHPLADLTQSSATTGQVPQWNGTAWIPATPVSAPEWGDITGTLSDQTDLQSALNAKQSTISGGTNKLIYSNGTGVIGALNTQSVNSYEGVDSSNTVVMNAEGFYRTINRKYVQANTIQDSGADSVELNSSYIELDVTKSGFDLGTSGRAALAHGTQINHYGNSDTGSLIAFQTAFNIGNGIDPISVNGFAYNQGFASVNSGVTLSGGIQGYGFQPNISSGVNVNQYTQAFYDSANFQSSINGYNSFSSNPYILAIKNGSGFSSFTSNPTIPTFEGNAGFTAVGIYGNLGTFNNGGYQGIQINPTIASVKYAVGIDVNMDHVTVTTGTPATVTIQDLTFTSIRNSSDYNGITFEFIDDVTAGSELITGADPIYEVHIQSGVSTATQVKAAFDGFLGLSGDITITISGVGSNPQVTQGAEALSGGTYDGSKKAARFQGDVEITGGLQFGGTLQIAKLNAFASQPLIDGGGDPQSVHQLISQLTVGNGITLANVDTLSLNTACLVEIGDNSHLTSTFLGVTAIGLPAVINMGNNSTIDKVVAATFALSLGGSGTGSIVDSIDLCRAIAIPDGVTTVNKLVGYKMDLPFGDPGTQTWGVKIDPAVFNYFAGSVKIGPGSDTATVGYSLDNVGGFRTESSLGEMIKATDAGLSFFGNTPVAKQSSSGAVSAGVVYTTTARTMIQEMYDALRSYGLLT